MTNWRDIKFEDAWNTLKGKYGEKLEWWHMAAAIASITKAPPTVGPVLQVDAVVDRVSIVGIFLMCSARHILIYIRRTFLIYLAESPASHSDIHQQHDYRYAVRTRRAYQRSHTSFTRSCSLVGIVGGRYGWTTKEEEFPTDLHQT